MLLKKLKSNKGATMTMALMILAIATLVSAIVFTSSISAAKIRSSEQESEQKMLAATSAVQLFKEDLQSYMYAKVAATYSAKSTSTTTTTGYDGSTSETSNPDIVYSPDPGYRECHVGGDYFDWLFEEAIDYIDDENNKAALAVNKYYTKTVSIEVPGQEELEPVTMEFSMYAGNDSGDGKYNISADFYILGEDGSKECKMQLEAPANLPISLNTNEDKKESGTITNVVANSGESEETQTDPRLAAMEKAVKKATDEMDDLAKQNVTVDYSEELENASSLESSVEKMLDESQTNIDDELNQIFNKMEGVFEALGIDEEQQEELKEAIKDVKEKYDDKIEDLKEKAENVSDAEEALENAQDAYDEQKEKLDDAKAEWDEALAKKSQLEAQVEELEAEQAKLEAENNTLSSEVTALKSQVSTLESEVKQLQKDVKSLQKEADKLEDSISSYENWISYYEGLRDSKWTVSTLKKNYQQQIDDYTNKKTTAETQLAAKNAEISTKNATITSKNSEITSLNSEITEKNDKISANKKQISSDKTTAWTLENVTIPAQNVTIQTKSLAYSAQELVTDAYSGYVTTAEKALQYQQNLYSDISEALVEIKKSVVSVIRNVFGITNSYEELKSTTVSAPEISYVYDKKCISWYDYQNGGIVITNPSESGAAE